MRINKFLAFKLGISRRNADELIKNDLVKVNNKIIRLGYILKKDDEVIYKNKVLNRKTEFQYFKFYKPKGYVCSNKQQGNSKTIYQLIKNKNLKYSGRLDKESEGLMLLSTDGKWLNENSHPSNEVFKKYIVSTNLKEINISNFKNSINEKNEILNIYSIEKKSDFNYLVVLKTGKNREIRRIFEYNKIKITNLKRISIGKYRLGKMNIGELKEIKI